MSKQEAKREMSLLSSGTLANLTGKRKYAELDEELQNIHNRIDKMDVTECRTWIEVWECISHPASVII